MAWQCRTSAKDALQVYNEVGHQTTAERRAEETRSPRFKTRTWKKQSLFLFQSLVAEFLFLVSSIIADFRMNFSGVMNKLLLWKFKLQIESLADSESFY